MAVSITTYHLEMLDPGELRPKRIERGDLEITRAEIPCPELNRFLYAAVGGDWFWIDRLGWTYRQWLDWLDRPESKRGSPTSPEPRPATLNWRRSRRAASR